MPFSSLIDPVDVARAHSALERAWLAVIERGAVLSSDATERQRLAVIVASLTPISSDEDDLVGLAIAHFLKE